MKKEKFKFTIITAVYNLEEYIEDMTQSVINQSMSFEKNVQLILVNDGSTDHTEEICLKYKNIYPNNIIYKNKESGGVSSARNLGLNYAQGKYINFMDGDDKLDKTALEKVFCFFEQNEKKIDVVSIGIKLFEKIEDDHPLNYKYQTTKIINLYKDFDYAQLSVGNTFIKKTAIRNRRFKEILKFFEDTVFINEIIMDKMTYGVVSNTYYYYRRRYDESSTVQSARYQKEWYAPTIKNASQLIMKLAKERFGYIPYYIQYLVTYDLQRRIRLREKETDKLSKRNIEEYVQEIKNLLKNIDDIIILKQRYISREYKIFMLKLKYDFNIWKKTKYIDGEFYFSNIQMPLYSIKKHNNLIIDVINIKNNQIQIHGRTNCILPEEDYKIYLKINNNYEEIKTIYDVNYNKYGLDTIVYSQKKFNINLPLDKEYSFEFYFKYKNHDMVKLKINYGVYSRINNLRKLSYVKNNNIVYAIKDGFVCKKCDLFLFVKRRLANIISLIKSRELKPLFVRLLYYFFKIFKRKEIWLISDKKTAANDNGMALFKYIKNNPHKGIKPYFIINKDCEDYKKVKKIGKVIDGNSNKFKLYFLLADKIISSQASEYMLNPFELKNEFFRDLYGYEFVFLQHGIIKHDLSDYLNLNKKNISMFVTTAKTEYESILQGNYGYDTSIVKLVGLTRYDNFNNNRQKIITIMPTWRKKIAGKMNYYTEIRDYNHYFKNSEYFKFYNNLINDDKLLQVMKEYGYKGKFVIHPCHINNTKDFKANDIFDVIEKFVNYQELFEISSLLVTDYSSVSYDFAYLGKPIIYTEFDKKEFYNSHTYVEGYFNTERDGFGPVAYDYSSTVDEIIKSIKNKCICEDKYKNRSKEFFAFNDKNNCERVYNCIKEM